MKTRNIGRVAGLVAAAAMWMGAGTSAHAAYEWQKITGNNVENLSGQLVMEVSGSGQNLILTFKNNVGIASSICDIYIDAPPAGTGGDSYFTGISVGGVSAGVSFSTPATPGSLPSQNNASPAFVSVAGISANSDSPVSDNGVNAAGEWVKLYLTLAGTRTVADVIAGLDSGEFRVGLHVQAIGVAGGSDSYVTGHDGNVVPEPSTYIAGALLLLPFAVSTFRILRRKRIA